MELQGLQKNSLIDLPPLMGGVSLSPLLGLVTGGTTEEAEVALGDF